MLSFANNNRQNIERLMHENSYIQRYLLDYLDSLVELSEFPGRYSSLPATHYNSLELKFLGGSTSTKLRNDKLLKLNMNYAKKYNVSPDVISRTMLARAFKYIIYKHIDFLNGNLSLQNYEDTVLVC